MLNTVTIKAPWSQRLPGPHGGRAAGGVAAKWPGTPNSNPRRETGKASRKYSPQRASRGPKKETGGVNDQSKTVGRRTMHNRPKASKKAPAVSPHAHAAIVLRCWCWTNVSTVHYHMRMMYSYQAIWPPPANTTYNII